MAEEPNKKMDRLLRDYASQRRKSAAVSLHPATRKTLQGEVARTYRPKAASSFWSRLRGFWPQIAFGSSLAVILVIAALSLRAPPEQRGPTQATAEDHGKKTLSTDSQLKATGPDPLELKDERAPEPPPLAQSAPAARDRARSVELSKESASPARRMTATTESLARANELSNLGNAMRVRFVELPDRGRREARSPLLTSFQFEQLGDDVRLHDADGSIYSGQLFPAVPQEQLANSSVLSFAPPPSMQDLTRNATEHLFRAEGTNRVLGKQVVVEGRYFERTNPVPSTENRISPQTSSTRAGASSTANPTKFRRAIIGQAVIGQTNQVPLNAVSVEP